MVTALLISSSPDLATLLRTFPVLGDTLSKWPLERSAGRDLSPATQLKGPEVQVFCVLAILNTPLQCPV